MPTHSPLHIGLLFLALPGLGLQARKDEREMRFSLEESMAELSEMAGTAGLEVAGSTYQRVLEPNPRTYIGTGKVYTLMRFLFSDIGGLG